MLKFMSMDDLNQLKYDIGVAEARVLQDSRPWEQEGLSIEDVLSFEEKAVLLGIPCKSHPEVRKDKEGEPFGNKILAMKMIRDRRRYGLKQSKDLMDEYQAGVQAGLYKFEIPEEEQLLEAENAMEDVPEVLT